MQKLLLIVAQRVAYVFAWALLLTPFASAQAPTDTVFTGGNPSAVAVNPVTNKIYVTNNGGGNVTVIDGATNSTTTVSAGSLPIAVAVNPVTNKIYVANSGANNVTVIDGASNSTAAVAAGTYPIAVAVNPVTNKIYVPNTNSNNVTVIDGATNSTATVAAGSLPTSVAVNPVTNKIYVANSGGTVTVIDGATNNTATVAVGSFSQSVAVNPITNKIYVANNSGGTVTVIDGATNSTTTVAAGVECYSVAVNPVTNKIYVANAASNTVTVIDGATNSTSTVATGTEPYSVAVNSVSNKIYVANDLSSSVTVIDGATNSTTTLGTGAGPDATVVNPVTNKTYVANFHSNSVTVIDGATNIPASVATGIATFALAVNPVTNQIYVANEGGLEFGSTDPGSVMVIDGATNTPTTLTTPGASTPRSVAINPITDKIYVANLTSNNLTVIDGANNNSAISVATGSGPSSVVVNPVTNQIYVSGSSVTAIDGVTNSPITLAVGGGALAINPVTNKLYVASNANAANNTVTVVDGVTGIAGTPITVGTGEGPVALAVNPVTNQIYVVNIGDLVHNSTVSVIDGATSTVTANLTVGVEPFAIAVNAVTNKIYVLNTGDGGASSISVIDANNGNSIITIPTGSGAQTIAVNPVTNKIYVGGGGNVIVIDGASGAPKNVTGGQNAEQIAVNPVTNTIYVANAGEFPTNAPVGSVTVIQEQQVTATPLTTTITPLANNQTNDSTPTFSFTADSTTVTVPDGEYFQIDTWQNAWTQATGSNPDFTGAVAAALQPGFHILYAYATDGQDATSTQAGSPLTGSIQAYGFLVVPPIPALVVSISNTGAFTQGQTGEWDVQVTNTGLAASATFGVTNVVDTLPTGYTLASYTGAGWTCNAATVTVTCTSSQVVAGADGSFSLLKLIVNIPSNSAVSVTDNVAAYGGGDTAHSSQASAATGFETIHVEQVPASISANAGTTPQSATIGTAFANALAVTVKDAGNNPIPNVNVVFKAPSFGASGLFVPNSSTTITLATNASGIATVPFSANAIAGGPYNVTASVNSLSTSFSLTNNAGAAAGLSANAGTTPQSAAIDTAFINALAVTIKDASSNPVAGVNVTFTAPTTGASGLFSNSTTAITVPTNASGIASAPFTANATAGGPYNVTASSAGLTSTSFALTNQAGAPASLTANAGTTPQSATVNTAFANALAVTVKDAGSNPVSGVNVIFTAPSTGASGLFGNSITSTVQTNSSGIASAPFTANANAGGPYNVTASSAGLTSTSFSLTNTAGAAAGLSANAGTTPQSAAIDTAFINALAVTIKDASSNPVAGVNVTFTAPTTGASGLFSNSTTAITVPTNASGIASAPFTANATAGGPYNVTASSAGLTSTSFALTNQAGAPASLTANAGTTPQSATVNTAFANALAVTVKDAGSNPVSGVNVIFTAPSAGASGLFGNSISSTVQTNSSGIASAPFTANATAGGPYNVTAAIGPLSTSFLLTNLAQQVAVTLNASPSGLQVSVDGAAAQTAPVNVNWSVGATHTIATTSPQGSNGTHYIFSGWSDGGAQSHVVTAATATTSYTATFNTSYLLTTSVNPPNEGTVAPSTASPTGDGYYPAGTQLNLTATPTSAANLFSNWTGTTSSSSNPLSITLNAPVSETANFGTNPGSAGSPLAYEPFGETAGTPLNGASGSGDFGWAAPWVEQYGSIVEPGYQTASSNPLTYPGLGATNSYAIGGYAYQSVGRTLNVSSTGPFGPYLANGLIGAPAQTIWISCLLREDANPANGEVNAIFLTPVGGSNAWLAQTGIGIGSFGGNWGLQYNNGTPVLSNVPVTPAQTVLLVASITFGATNQINLYVNPTLLGGSAPATASAQLTTTGSVAFQTVSYLGGYTAQDASLSDIQIGSTYGSVTHTLLTSQTITFSPLASPVTYPAGPINLTATASSNLPVTFSVLSGPALVNGNTLTITGVGTVMVAANQTGNYLYAPAPQVTQSIVVSVAGAPPTPVSTALLAYEPFNENSGIALNGASGGGDSGWNGTWVEQYGATVEPGYEIVSANPLTYSGLQPTTNYAIGGYAYQSAGRQLSVDPAGPFSSYLSNGLIGAPGQTVWLSFLLREDANPNNGQINAVFLTPNAGDAAWISQTGIGIGYFGDSPYWGLQLNNGAPILSSVPVQQGQTLLMVVSITFGATNQVNLYVNPTPGTTPATASAQLTSAATVAFESLSYLGGYGTNESSLAAIRFGSTYAAVTPTTGQTTQATQTITFTAPASPVTYPVAPITLSATASSGLPVTLSVMSGPGSVTGTTLTVTGTGTIVIAANQAGNASYAPAPQVTQSILVNPSGGVSSGALLAYEPFGETSGSPLQGAAGGGDSGWNGAWVEQEGSTATPGYQIASANLLTYAGLNTTGNYAIGGYGYQSAGRQLNTAVSGPFLSYLANGLIGAPGQTIWLSFLLREDANPGNGQINAIFLTPDNVPWVTQTGIGIGYFGASPYWGLQLNNGTPILSSVPVQQGQAVLMVVSITFGAINQINLYVNPASLGGAAPAMPSAQLATTANVAFQSFSYLGGYLPNESSLGDIRFGSSYDAVTP